MADETTMQAPDIPPSSQETPTEEPNAELVIADGKIIDITDRAAQGSESPVPGEESKAPDAEQKNLHCSPKENAKPEDKAAKPRKGRSAKVEKSAPGKEQGTTGQSVPK